jgi:hypothetical protein
MGTQDRTEYSVIACGEFGVASQRAGPAGQILLGPDTANALEKTFPTAGSGLPKRH